MGAALLFPVAFRVRRPLAHLNFNSKSTFLIVISVSNSVANSDVKSGELFLLTEELPRVLEILYTFGSQQRIRSNNDHRSVECEDHRSCKSMVCTSLKVGPSVRLLFAGIIITGRRGVRAIMSDYVASISRFADSGLSRQHNCRAGNCEKLLLCSAPSLLLFPDFNFGKT